LTLNTYLTSKLVKQTVLWC